MALETIGGAAISLWSPAGDPERGRKLTNFADFGNGDSGGRLAQPRFRLDLPDAALKNRTFSVAGTRTDGPQTSRKQGFFEKC